MDLKQALLGGSAAVALGVGLLGSPVVVEAQQSQGTIITQSASRADAATFIIGNSRTSCTTSQDSVANLTATITPPAGNYVYLTGVYFEVAPNATAATSNTLWTSSNLTGSPQWLTGVTAAAAANPSSPYFINEVYPTAIKSTVAGTAVTIVPSATTASTFICMHAVGFYNPS